MTVHYLDSIYGVSDIWIAILVVRNVKDCASVDRFIGMIPLSTLLE